MITRYDFMQTQTQADGTVYPDVLSFPMKKLVLKDPCEQVLVREEDYLRPDLFFFKKKGTVNMMDIQLWVNQVPSKRDMKAGIKLSLPSNDDLNTFYIKYRV